MEANKEEVYVITQWDFEEGFVKCLSEHRLSYCLEWVKSYVDCTFNTAYVIMTKRNAELAESSKKNRDFKAKMYR